MNIKQRTAAWQSQEPSPRDLGAISSSCSTMRQRPLSTLILLLLLPALACAQRRGGGGDGGHGGDSDFDDDNGGDNDDSGGGGGGGGDDPPVFKSMPCGWHERQRTFGLPGIYYNGSITIRHHITKSTVWDEELEDDDPDSGCDNDDGSPKTYTYPALLLIAPAGNESDTNPMHWALRAFQPADQLKGTSDGFIDIAQRWVYIRSSDFIVRNETLRDPDNSVFWSLLDTWRDSDATRLNQDTRVYWPTNITSGSDGVYAARAEYAQTPPGMRALDYRLSSRIYGKHTSQFVTLSDVCVRNQVRNSITSSPEGMPSSHIDNGEESRRTSTPTVWLTKGATAELLNMGAASMTMTLNNSLDATVPLSGGREAGCPGSDPDPFEMGHFGLVHSKDDTSADPKPWTVTLSISVSFQGSIVRENSTSIDGFENGKLVFGETYDELLRETAEIRYGDDDNDGSRTARWGAQAWAGLVFCALLAMAGY